LPRKYYNLSRLVEADTRISHDENYVAVDRDGVVDRVIIGWKSGTQDLTTMVHLVSVDVKVDGNPVTSSPVAWGDAVITLEPEMPVRAGSIISAEIDNGDKDNRHEVLVLVGVRYE